MSVEISTLVWKFAPYRGTDLLVLLALADWSNDCGVCYPSIKKLATKVRTEKRQVQAIIRKIERDGFLAIDNRGAEHRSNVFTINAARLMDPQCATLHDAAGDTKDAVGCTPSVQSSVAEDAAECIPNRQDPSHDPSLGSVRSDVLEIFGFWQEVCEHPDAKLITGKDRDMKIRARRADGYGVAYIKLAIVGCHLTPHNRGENDRNRKFDDIELICRTAVKLEGFHDTAKSRGIVDPDAWLAARRAAKAEDDARHEESSRPKPPPVPAPPKPTDPQHPFVDVMRRVEAQIDKQAFATWFSVLSCAGMDDNVLILWAPNPVVRDWISKKYAKPLSVALAGRKFRWQVAGDQIQSEAA